MLRAMWVFLLWFVHLRLASSFTLGQAFQRKAHRSTDVVRHVHGGNFVPGGARRSMCPFRMFCAGHRLYREDDTALYSAIQSQPALAPGVNESLLSEAVVNKLFASRNDSLDFKNMTLLFSSTCPFSTHTYEELGTSCAAWADKIASGGIIDAKEYTILSFVSGKGLDKSTFLCEVTKALNCQDDTMAVGISFGDRWDSTTLLEPLVLQEGDKKADSDAEALVGVAVRMWSMIANVPFPEAVSSFRSTIREVSMNHNVQDVSTLSVSFAQQLLAQMIVSYVELQRSKHGKPGVERFILLVDDVDKGNEAYGLGPKQREEGNAAVRKYGLKTLVSRTFVPARTQPEGEVVVPKLFESCGLGGGMLTSLSIAVEGESDFVHTVKGVMPLRRSSNAETDVEEEMCASEDSQNKHEGDIMTPDDTVVSIVLCSPGNRSDMSPVDVFNIVSCALKTSFEIDAREQIDGAVGGCGSNLTASKSDDTANASE